MKGAGQWRCPALKVNYGAFRNRIFTSIDSTYCRMTFMKVERNLIMEISSSFPASIGKGGPGQKPGLFPF